MISNTLFLESVVAVRQSPRRSPTNTTAVRETFCTLGGKHVRRYDAQMLPIHPTNSLQRKVAQLQCVCHLSLHIKHATLSQLATLVTCFQLSYSHLTQQHNVTKICQYRLPRSRRRCESCGLWFEKRAGYIHLCLFLLSSIVLVIFITKYPHEADNLGYADSRSAAQ